MTINFKGLCGTCYNAYNRAQNEIEREMALGKVAERLKGKPVQARKEKDAASGGIPDMASTMPIPPTQRDTAELADRIDLVFDADRDAEGAAL